ncbi:MAG: metallopeptidase [Thermoprotei archaeon]|nr:MAG: metallopeptidase [Thermoprotei archaeon]
MSRLKLEQAPDVRKMVYDIVVTLNMDWIDIERIGVLRSKGSKSTAIARIYGLPRVFQTAFKLEPLYVIEVISERFDKLNQEDQIKVLIHELLHIPKSFSGGLRAHGKYVNHRIISKLYREYLKRKGARQR